MKVEPLDGRVAVIPFEPNSVTKGGVILPSASQDHPHRGTVIAVGPGHMTENGMRIPMTLQVGDVVAFGAHSGTNIEEDGQPVKLMHEIEILARLTPGSSATDPSATEKHLG